MRTKIIGLLMWVAIAAALAAAGPAQAKGPVFFSLEEEHVIKVADFPKTKQFQTAEGHYVDPGFRYRQISVFFVPVWNYGGRWCGYVGDSEHYVDLNKETLDTLAGMAGVELPASPRLPLWQSLGGKLVLLAGLGFYFIVRRSRGE